MRPKDTTRLLPCRRFFNFHPVNQIFCDHSPIWTEGLEDADVEILSKLVEELENNDEVQEVFTNAE